MQRHLRSFVALPFDARSHQRCRTANYLYILAWGLELEVLDELNYDCLHLNYPVYKGCEMSVALKYTWR